MERTDEPASESWVERTAGLFYEPEGEPLTAEELREAAADAWADEAQERAGMALEPRFWFRRIRLPGYFDCEV